MRIVAIRGDGGPRWGEVSLKLGPGLVAVVGSDGRVRRDVHQLLAGETEGVRRTTRPRVPDPVLTRLSPELRRLLESGGESQRAEQVVEAGTRSLGLLAGLDRLEAARLRLVRLQGTADPPAVADTEALMARIRELEEAPAELEALEEDLRELRGNDAEVVGDVEAATMEWLRERQDAETQLGAYRDRARELKERLSELHDAGSDATCPTCDRPLADHAEAVLERLQDEWESVVQDGSWWRRRREQLELKPERLQELEGRALRLHAETEALADKVDEVRERVRALEEARLRLAERVGGRGGPDGSTASGAAVPEAVWAEVDRALSRAAREVREASRAMLLDRMSRILARITGGRVLSAAWSEAGRLDLFGIEGSLHPPSEEDAAAAHMAARLAAAQTVCARAGTPFPPLILHEPFDRLDEAVKVRTVALLKEMVEPGSVFEQILVVTGSQVVDLYPEAFDLIVEVRREALSGPASFQMVPAGLGNLSLS